MNLLRDEEQHFRKLRSIVQRFYADDRQLSVDKYLYQNVLTKNLNSQSDTIMFLLDFKNFEILYLCGNILKKLGYEKDELIKSDITSSYSFLDKKSVAFPTILTIWYLDILKQVESSYKEKQQGFCWGFIMKGKNEKRIKGFYHFTPIEFDEYKQPILLLVSVKDITHLIKKNNETMWFRGVLGRKDKIIFTHNVDENKTLQQDIITNREKEILRYIIDGYDSKEIAEFIQISPNTVDNHRRNMIARTGTRDTTALIQLCKMMNVL